PDKIISTITGPQGAITQGFNGTVGWVKTDKEVREMRSAELARLKIGRGQFEVLNIRQVSQGMALAGKEIVNNRETFVIVRPVDNEKTQRLYIDTQSGLLLRVLTVTQTILTKIPEQIDFEDYRSVE